MGLCDKCGLPVDPHNDLRNIVADMAAASAVFGEWQAPGSGAAEIMGLVYTLKSPSRHFLPLINEEGEVLCEGSPSRAQYIEGQPRDSRPEYPYDKRDETAWRRSFAYVQVHEYDT